jgi:hypothetical protein
VWFKGLNGITCVHWLNAPEKTNPSINLLMGYVPTPHMFLRKVWQASLYQQTVTAL